MHAADPKTEQAIRAFIRAYEERFSAIDATARPLCRGSNQNQPEMVELKPATFYV